MDYFYKTDQCAIYNEDNLKAMRSLPDNYIDMIYCDVLYGTGRNFGEYQDLKADRNIIIEHYVPRFKEMSRLLKLSGNIYIHCDYRITHWIRIIMDDIFGYNNFINEIIWCYRSGGGSKKSFRKQHDNIALYAKDIDKSKFELKTEKSYMAHKYGFNNIEEFYDEEKDAYYVFSGMKDWVEINIVPNKKKHEFSYPTRKPVDLVTNFILCSSNKGDIVADFYMGSGTTGEAAIRLGRKFIGCDTSERACEITKERIENLE